MTEWTPFAAFAVAFTGGLVALTRASARVLRGGDLDVSPLSLLVQASGTQVVAGAVLAAGLWLAGVPLRALGLAWSPRLLGVGVVAGVAFSLGNEAAMRALDALGVAYDESLRDALTPDTRAGWVFLLAVALPVIAVFEEALFRGVLIGALGAGFGVSPWVLVFPSSVAFGAAHTAQGGTGVVVTSLLGAALASVYVATGSLPAVVVAHYVVNALEFVAHAR